MAPASNIVICPAPVPAAALPGRAANAQEDARRVKAPEGGSMAQGGCGSPAQRPDSCFAQKGAPLVLRLLDNFNRLSPDARQRFVERGRALLQTARGDARLLELTTPTQRDELSATPSLKRRAQEVEAEPHGGQGAQGATADAAGSSQFTSAKKQRQDSSPDASSGPPATSTHAGHGGASSEARDAGAPAPSAETIATSDVPRRSSAPTGAYAVLMAAGRARQGRASTAPKPPSQDAPLQSQGGSRFVTCPACTRTVAALNINLHMDTECEVLLGPSRAMGPGRKRGGVTELGRGGAVGSQQTVGTQGGRKSGGEFGAATGVADGALGGSSTGSGDGGAGSGDGGAGSGRSAATTCSPAAPASRPASPDSLATGSPGVGRPSVGSEEGVAQEQNATVRSVIGTQPRSGGEGGAGDGAEPTVPPTPAPAAVLPVPPTQAPACPGDGGAQPRGLRGLLACSESQHVGPCIGATQAAAGPLPFPGWPLPDGLHARASETAPRTLAKQGPRPTPATVSWSASVEPRPAEAQLAQGLVTDGFDPSTMELVLPGTPWPEPLPRMLVGSEAFTKSTAGHVSGGGDDGGGGRGGLVTAPGPGAVPGASLDAAGRTEDGLTPVLVKTSMEASVEAPVHTPMAPGIAEASPVKAPFEASMEAPVQTSIDIDAVKASPTVAPVPGTPAGVASAPLAPCDAGDGGEGRGVQETRGCGERGVQGRRCRDDLVPSTAAGGSGAWGGVPGAEGAVGSEEAAGRAGVERALGVVLEVPGTPCISEGEGGELKGHGLEGGCEGVRDGRQEGPSRAGEGGNERPQDWCQTPCVAKTGTPADAKTGTPADVNAKTPAWAGRAWQGSAAKEAALFGGALGTPGWGGGVPAGAGTSGLREVVPGTPAGGEGWTPGAGSVVDGTPHARGVVNGTPLAQSATPSEPWALGTRAWPGPMRRPGSPCHGVRGFEILGAVPETPVEDGALRGSRRSDLSGQGGSQSRAAAGADGVVLSQGAGRRTERERAWVGDAATARVLSPALAEGGAGDGALEGRAVSQVPPAVSEAVGAGPAREGQRKGGAPCEGQPEPHVVVPREGGEARDSAAGVSERGGGLGPTEGATVAVAQGGLSPMQGASGAGGAAGTLAPPSQERVTGVTAADRSLPGATPHAATATRAPTDVQSRKLSDPRLTDARPADARLPHVLTDPQPRVLPRAQRVVRAVCLSAEERYAVVAYEQGRDGGEGAVGIEAWALPAEGPGQAGPLPVRAGAAVITATAAAAQAERGCLPSLRWSVCAAEAGDTLAVLLPSCWVSGAVTADMHPHPPMHPHTHVASADAGRAGKGAGRSRPRGSLTVLPAQPCAGVPGTAVALGPDAPAGPRRVYVGGAGGSLAAFDVVDPVSGGVTHVARLMDRGGASRGRGGWQSRCGPSGPSHASLLRLRVAFQAPAALRGGSTCLAAIAVVRVRGDREGRDDKAVVFALDSAGDVWAWDAATGAPFTTAPVASGLACLHVMTARAGAEGSIEAVGLAVVPVQGIGSEACRWGDGHGAGVAWERVLARACGHGVSDELMAARDAPFVSGLWGCEGSDERGWDGEGEREGLRFKRRRLSAFGFQAGGARGEAGHDTQCEGALQGVVLRVPAAGAGCGAQLLETSVTLCAAGVPCGELAGSLGSVTAVGVRATAGGGEWAAVLPWGAVVVAGAGGASVSQMPGGVGGRGVACVAVAAAGCVAGTASGDVLWCPREGGSQ